MCANTGVEATDLGVDMFSHKADPSVVLQALDVAVGFQHNMHVQPRLVPGENPLWLEAADVDKGTTLTAEWVHQIGGKEHRPAITLDKAGKAEDGVTVDVACPSDIRMTSVKVNCV